MRKLWTSLLAISFFVATLSGCTVTNPTSPKLSFSAVATIRTDDFTMVADVVSSDNSDVYVKVATPNSIKGLSYHLVNSTLYIEYDGLRCNTSGDYLTSYNPFDVISSILNSLTADSLEYQEDTQDAQVFKGRSPHGVYEIHLLKKSGEILYIRPEYTDCEITFSYS